ncbi:MAG: hypothetical protein K9G70_09075 [Prolixibacteraceae bacterium]|nr:hypothetical protein [Prolixibacteraceae bacterium]
MTNKNWKISWYIDIAIFTLLTVVNFVTFLNYEDELRHKDYFGYDIVYDFIIFLFDDFIGKWTGLIFWEVVAIIFLYTGIKKIRINK